MSASGHGWFGRKRFGFGYGPRSWQGWLITAVYAALMIGVPRVISARTDHVWLIGMMVLLTVAYLAIFFWKLDRTGR
ncbi:hypothetical protein [Dyella sp. S184]|uniref:hypothetical protein n=1 Tax=Dyella sp. S184 TaxID=1641862 RepID=UPI00131DA7A7|nr:hypothetical protein [Dyella sp. S184]